MTRLRSTVLVVSVVLFSLALGIALGGGLLQGPVRSTLQSEVRAVTDGDQSAALRRDKRALTQASRFDTAFAETVAPRLLDGRMSGRAALVLALPGVPESQAKAVAADVNHAGGSVTATLRAGKDFADPTAQPLVDELTRRLLPGLDDVEVPDGASAYTRLGLVTARALLTREDGGEALDEDARSLFNTLTTAKLLEGPEPQQRADAVVLLLPEQPVGRPAGAGRGLVLTDITQALSEGADGVVVAGPPSSADARNLLAVVRSSASTAESVSTVDGVDVRAGQLATVLALAEQTQGETGHYGVGPGADAVLPGSGD